MKKLLFILILSITIPSLTYAKCDGGVETKGKNGHDCCISNQTMNWWSAFAWCKANERHLATIAEACGNQHWSNYSNVAVGISQGGWTSTAFEDNKAYSAYLEYSHVAQDTRTTKIRALCY